jgi:hypothetical protein
MADAYVMHGLRTPFGKHGGGLAGVRPDDLATEPQLTPRQASYRPGDVRLG